MLDFQFFININFDNEQPLIFLNILTVYNNHGANSVALDARKPLSHQAFRASLTLAAAGYIGP